jgi:hypothetical protein
MTFLLLAGVAAFASFALVNAAASALLALAFPRFARVLDRYSPGSRAALLFQFRLAPAALAVIVGFGVALPIFVAFEPLHTDEPVSRTLLVMALGGGVVLLHAAHRTFAAWRATARTTRTWQRTGRRIDPLTVGIETSIPVYVIDELFPMVAVVGIVRPVLFVAARVLTECSAEEVRTIVAHECAHVEAADNLKRFALRACPDFLGATCSMSRTWASAAEQAADAAAISSRPESALDLAQALIRVARLSAPVVPALASAFYPGGSIEARVKRLVNPPLETPAPVVLRGWMLAVALVVLAAGVAFAGPALHQAMEIAVRQLP